MDEHCTRDAPDAWAASITSIRMWGAWQVLNITDAYSSKIFDPQSDARTGYRTNSVLCVPMYDHLMQPLGVLQLINKVPKGLLHDEAGIQQYIQVQHVAKLTFGQRDQEVATAFACLAGLAVERNYLWSVKSLFE